MVGIGRATTAKSDAIFSTACDKVTVSRHFVVPVLRGLHGPPVIMHNINV